MNRTIYLTKQEDDFIKTKPKGFLRSLVRAAMEEKPSAHQAQKVVRPRTAPSKEPPVQNPYRCPKCGRIKVAGKCLDCG